MTILPKILRSGNPLLTVSAAVGAFAGLLMLLLSLQLFIDVREIANRSDNFVIVNKKISIVSTAVSFMGAKTGGFTDEEIQEIRSQPFVKKAAPFTSSKFRVTAGSSSLGFQTEFFFQALPNSFLDIDTTEFHWHAGQLEVPMIVSYDFLALYNFSFAPSQNLPPLTAKTIGRVNLRLILMGRGPSEGFDGRIIGFSRRINTILVPLNFLEKMNAQLGDKETSVNQIVVEASNPYSKAFQKFLSDHQYEISRGFGDKVQGFATVFVPIIASLGILITLLSLLVFVLNFQLIVSKASGDIRLLLQLGYKPGSITGLINKRFYIQLTMIFLCTAIALVGLKYLMAGYFIEQGFEVSSLPSMIVWMAGGVLAVLFVMVNTGSVKKGVKNLG